MDHRLSFQRKSYGLNGFDTFFSHFSAEFWFLHVLVVVFIIMSSFVMFF